jgi:hypothetical protein
MFANIHLWYCYNHHSSVHSSSVTHFGALYPICSILSSGAGLFAIRSSQTVIDVREGAMLFVQGNRMTLEGINGGKLFVKEKKPQEIQIGDDLSSHLI